MILANAAVNVVEGDWGDLAESSVEFGEECNVIELKETSDFRCPLQERWAVDVDGCWHRQPCVGLSHHVDMEVDDLYVVAVVIATDDVDEDGFAADVISETQSSLQMRQNGEILMLLFWMKFGHGPWPTWLSIDEGG